MAACAASARRTGRFVAMLAASILASPFTNPTRAAAWQHAEPGPSGPAAVGIATAAPSPPPPSVDRWARVLLDGVTVGHVRRTVTSLEGGHVVTRIEQTWSRSGRTDATALAYQLVVEEDASGRVLALEQRRFGDGRWLRMTATVDGDELAVDAGDQGRFRVPWTDSARGPDHCRRDRAGRWVQGQAGARFRQVEFDWDLGRAVTSDFEVIERGPEALRLRAVGVGLGGRSMDLWSSADGTIVRSSLELPIGTRTTTPSDRSTALAGVSLPTGWVDRHAGVVVAGDAVRLPAPAGYAWLDWSGGSGAELRARAENQAGARIDVVEDSAVSGQPLAMAATGDPLVLVEREAGGRPAIVIKDRQTGTWGLVVALADGVLLVRSSGRDDASMGALLELADALLLVD